LVINIVASIADAEPLAGPEHEQIRQEFSMMVQNIWFAELVGWASGIRSKEQLVKDMYRATDVIVKGLLIEKV
jgi:hypothetical protein